MRVHVVPSLEQVVVNMLIGMTFREVQNNKYTCWIANDAPSENSGRVCKLNTNIFKDQFNIRCMQSQVKRKHLHFLRAYFNHRLKYMWYLNNIETIQITCKCIFGELMLTNSCPTLFQFLSLMYKLAAFSWKLPLS